MVPIGSPIRTGLLRSVFAMKLLFSPRFAKKFSMWGSLKEAIGKAQHLLGASIEEALRAAETGS